MQIGDPFDEVQAQEGSERLLEVYERHGYRDMHLTRDKPFEADGRAVLFTYHIDEGTPTRVGTSSFKRIAAPRRKSSPVSWRFVRVIP
jgi:outer membrane protein assembly factor BamA